MGRGSCFAMRGMPFFSTASSIPFLMKHTFSLLAAMALAVPLASQAQKKAASATTTNAEAAIKEADIKRDLYVLADDKYRGREGGTLDELRADGTLAKISEKYFGSDVSK